MTAALAAPDGAPGPNAGKADLLHTSPFDRLTLVDNTVISIEPLNPRPLPPPEKESRAKKRTRDGKVEIPEEGNIGLPGEKSKVEMPVRKEDEERTKTS